MGSNSSRSSPVGPFIEYDTIKAQLQTGDLIEIQRNSTNWRNEYKHWVIFEQIDQNGNVWCFHVSGVPDQDCDDSKAVAYIKYEHLLDILKDNESSEPSLSRINNHQNMAKEMMRITGNEMLDIKEVFKMLHKFKDTTVKYDFQI